MTTFSVDEAFWSSLDQWVVAHPLKIDRPRGSSHPRFPGLVYPLDYGYLEGTVAPDGEAIDAWVGSQPSRLLQAIILSLDLGKDDLEVKLLLGCSPAEQRMILDFHRRASIRAILISRQTDGLGWLITRRSIRHFTAQPVPDDVLEQILEAATWAPSAHNRQPWRFVLLASADSRKDIVAALRLSYERDFAVDGILPPEAAAKVARSHQRIIDAPAAVLLCLEAGEVDHYPDPSRRQAALQMAIQSVALAGGHILLAAHALGLGGVWVCAPLFAQEAVCAALRLPNTWLPQGLILLGYPASQPSPPPRKSLAELLYYR